MPTRRAALLTVAAAALPAQTMRFDSKRVQATLSDWSFAMTHEGEAPQWKIVADSTAPSSPFVLAQTSTDKTAGRFPLAIYRHAKLKDGIVSVLFKPVAGERDQAAGLVWRYQDPNHYYIARANALEDNVVTYKVEKGERTSLRPPGLLSKSYGVKHRIPTNSWTALQVHFWGNYFEVSINGARVMALEDDTFTDAGQVGLWTKADSVIHFDNMRVQTRVRGRLSTLTARSPG
jgi:hypothetical protein